MNAEIGKYFARLALLPVLLLCPTAASATAIFLQPSANTIAIGASFSVDVVADIDVSDEVLGFGFDLAGVNLGLLAFNGFTAGTGFADDPIFLAPVSDADGIRGASSGNLFLGTPVSGTGIVLGTLMFQAISIGQVELSLDADDLSFFFSEGLIPADTTLGNFMPVIEDSRVEIVAGQRVPEPSSLLLCAGAILAACSIVSGRTTSRLEKNLN